MARGRLNAGRGLRLAAVALAAAPFVLGAVVNPDLWWHLSAGRWIVAHGAIPRADWLSWTRPGGSWIDFEWLSELVFYSLRAAFGVGGLVFVRAACYGGALCAVLRGLGRRGLSDGARGLGALLFASALLPLMDVRPDNFSVLLFAVLLDALDEFRLSRRPLRKRDLAACAALFALWSNLHLGLAYGLLLIGLFAAGEAGESLWSARLPPLGRGSRLRAYAALLTAGAAGSLLNPHGAALYSALFQHARELPLLERIIAEWAPPDLSNPWLWPYALLLLLTAAATLAAVARGRRPHFGVLLSASYFGWASTQHQRHVPYFAVAALPALFDGLSELGLTGPERRRARVAGFALALLLVAHSARRVWPTFPLVSGSLWLSAPGHRLADYLESEPALADRRLFHSWGYGGYLGWRLAPRFLVFYDGRYIFHPLYADSQAAFEGAAAWRAFLNTHDVDVAALGRRDKPGIDGRPYYASYMPAEDWALVAWNDFDLVFARRSAFARDWLKSREYRLLLPDDEARLLEDAKSKRFDLKLLDEELSRHAAQPGASPRETAYLAGLRARLR